MVDIVSELQEKVLDAYHNKQPLEIIGGASKKFMGREALGEPLNVAAHSGIVTYQPVELVITARAGTTLVELAAVLAENNQQLAFEPPSFSPASTIGGTLACNQSGPARPWSGSVRDHVLGVRLINGRGEHLKFGGQVMKNVAGYDVSRLQSGAMGSLGVMTEISLKVLPKPATSKTVSWDMDAAQAITFINQLCGKAKPISAACWIEGKLFVRLCGAQSAVEATIKHWQGQVEEDAQNFWQQLRHQQLHYFNGEDPLWRFSVNPNAQLPSLDDQSIIDWGGAQRWFKGQADKVEMENIAAQANGQVVFLLMVIAVAR